MPREATRQIVSGARHLLGFAELFVCDTGCRDPRKRGVAKPDPDERTENLRKDLAVSRTAGGHRMHWVVGDFCALDGYAGTGVGILPHADSRGFASPHVVFPARQIAR
jgi:hypothetical protein